MYSLKDFLSQLHSILRWMLKLLGSLSIKSPISLGCSQLLVKGSTSQPKATLVVESGPWVYPGSGSLNVTQTQMATSPWMTVSLWMTPSSSAVASLQCVALSIIVLLLHVQCRSLNYMYISVTSLTDLNEEVRYKQGLKHEARACYD